jgi:hypothetical protein
MTIKTRTNTGQSSNTMAAGVAVCARQIASGATRHYCARDRHRSRFGRPSFVFDVFCDCPCRAQNPREPSPSSRPSRIGFQDSSIYPTTISSRRRGGKSPSTSWSTAKFFHRRLVFFFFLPPSLSSCTDFTRRCRCFGSSSSTVVDAAQVRQGQDGRGERPSHSIILTDKGKFSFVSVGN